MLTQLSARSFRARRSFGASAPLAGMPAWLAALLSFAPVRALLAVVLLAAGGGLGVAHAQATAHFDGVITTLGGGFRSPQGVAVDGSGNVYVVDLSNSAVKEIPTSCISSSCVTTVGGGFSYPFGVAADGGGNVYVADYGSNAVKEIPVGCNSSNCVTTLGGGFSYPTGVAVDGSGNVYVADTTVKEIPIGCTSSSCVTTLGSGVNYPTSVAVDGSGNVYVADYNNRAVKEIPAGCTSSRCVATLSGYYYPDGVTVDGSDNVYVSSNNAVKEIPAGCTSSSCVTMVGVSFNKPQGLSVDSSNNVYVADYYNGAVKEIALGSVNFQTVAVGATSPLQTLTFTVDSAGTLGTPLVLTQGAPNLDYTDAGTGTCTTNGAAHSYNAGDTCTVDVVFSPKFAGTRNGAVVLDDASGTPIATVYLYGTGTGPQIAFSPATQTTLVGSDLSFPFSAAVDGSGNIYIADPSNNRVLRETLSGGSYTQTTVGSGLSTPYGAAVDGAGHVYIADSGNSRVLLETPSGSGYTQTTIGSGLGFPNAVAVDGSGNAYIADTFNNRVLKETLSGGSYAQSTVASGLNSPHGVAVDGSGNVYIADTSTNRVLLETPAGGTYTQTTIGSGFNNPANLAVDASGNVYIADSGSNTVFKETASGGSYTQTTVASGLSNPNGVAVDGSGDVYIADSFNNRVLEENVATPPALTFAATPVGQTSSDSPQSFQVENIGNQPLNAVPPGLAIGANFAQVAGSGTPEDCTTSFSLTPGAACNLSISFTPTMIGQISSSAVFTDNNLNASPSAMQTVPLSGTGNAPAPSIGFTVGNQSYGAAPFMVAATSNSTGAITYSVVSGPATVSGSTVTVTGAGSVTLQASQAAAGNYAAGSQSTTFTVAAAAPSIGFTVANQTYGAAPFMVAATSNSTGAITYSVVSGPATISGSTVTVTGAGSVTLMASQAAAGNYAAGSMNATFAVAKAGSTISLAGMANSTGNTATLTATVGSASTLAAGVAGPTGMVTFSNAGGTIGTAILVNGVAQLTTAAYTGSQSFTATYNGDSNFTNSATSNTVTLNFTVNPTLTFTIPGSSVYGQSFSVKAASNSTGAITYSLVSGPATVSAAGALTVTGEGMVTVLASQAAASGYNMYTQTASFTATQASSTTRLTATAVKSGYGTAATLTATVSPQYTGTPTGSVTFYDGTTKLTTLALTSGTATYTTPQLVGASHSFSATYTGDTDFTGSNSNTAALTIPVTAVSLQLLATQLVYPLPPAFGLRVGTGASPAPTGTVSFYDGTTVVATYPLFAVTQGYLLGLVLPPLNVGTHMLEAVYSGDASHAPGQSAIVTVTVIPGPVKLSLSCASTKLTLGQTLSCTANANEGLLPVTGTVNYTITGWGSGSVTLNKSGQASITYLEPNKGTFTLSATYAAQGNYQAAQPANVPFTVN